MIKKLIIGIVLTILLAPGTVFAGQATGGSTGRSRQLNPQPLPPGKIKTRRHRRRHRRHKRTTTTTPPK